MQPLIEEFLTERLRFKQILGRHKDKKPHPPTNPGLDIDRIPERNSLPRRAMLLPTAGTKDPNDFSQEAADRYEATRQNVPLVQMRGMSHHVQLNHDENLQGDIHQFSNGQHGGYRHPLYKVLNKIGTATRKTIDFLHKPEAALTHDTIVHVPLTHPSLGGIIGKVGSRSEIYGPIAAYAHTGALEKNLAVHQQNELNQYAEHNGTDSLPTYTHVAHVHLLKGQTGVRSDRGLPGSGNKVVIGDMLLHKIGEHVTTEHVKHPVTGEHHEVPTVHHHYIKLEPGEE